jgi:hypothetical protein
LRGADGFPSEPKVIKGLAAAIEITSLQIALPLAEIYAA